MGGEGERGRGMRFSCFMPVVQDIVSDDMCGVFLGLIES